MGIITTAELTTELPAGYDASRAATAVTRASRLVNSWATHYDPFPEATETPAAPDEIKLITLDVAKACYFIGIGQIFRGGNEQDAWQKLLDRAKKELADIQIEPVGLTQVIALNSLGVQLIGSRGQRILAYHPSLCKVVVTAPDTHIWNQDVHWFIRKGADFDAEYIDGWYFDGSSYRNDIAGTLYYARSWRNDGYDYLRYGPRILSMNVVNGSKNLSLNLVNSDISLDYQRFSQG